MIFKGLKGKYSILSFHLSHQTKPNLSGSAREASVAVWWIHTISGKVGSHFSSRTNGREEKEREERLYLWSVSLRGLIPVIVWNFLLSLFLFFLFAWFYQFYFRFMLIGIALHALFLSHSLRLKYWLASPWRMMFICESSGMISIDDEQIMMNALYSRLVHVYSDSSRKDLS